MSTSPSESNTINIAMWQMTNVLDETSKMLWAQSNELLAKITEAEANGVVVEEHIKKFQHDLGILALNYGNQSVATGEAARAL